MLTFFAAAEPGIWFAVNRRWTWKKKLVEEDEDKFWASGVGLMENSTEFWDLNLIKNF